MRQWEHVIRSHGDPMSDKNANDKLPDNLNPYVRDLYGRVVITPTGEARVPPYRGDRAAYMGGLGSNPHGKYRP